MAPFRVVVFSASVTFAVTVLVGFISEPSEKIAADPVPDESVSVGRFRIDRWKHHYLRGDAFVDRGDFYWESKLRYNDKTIDFCTPRGWGGSALCSDRRYLGWFSLSTPSIVSDSPPAVLVPYGGTSGNNDGELWLFTDTGQGFEKRRVALDSEHGVTDLEGNRVDYSPDWDSRKHEFLLLNNDTWLHTPSLRVLEFSRPAEAYFQEFVSFSPDRKKIARVGYVDNRPDKSVPLLIINEVDQPSRALVYRMDDFSPDEHPGLSELVRMVATRAVWYRGAGGFQIRSKGHGLRLTRVDALLQNNVLSRTAPQRDRAEVDYFFQGKESELAVTQQKILEAFGKSQMGELASIDAARIDLGDWGSYRLVFSDRQIYLKESDGNWDTRHVASVIQRKMLSKAAQSPYR